MFNFWRKFIFDLMVWFSWCTQTYTEYYNPNPQRLAENHSEAAKNVSEAVLKRKLSYR